MICLRLWNDVIPKNPDYDRRKGDQYYSPLSLIFNGCKRTLRAYVLKTTLTCYMN